MNPFWESFWSNFLANIAVVVVLSAFGFLAKGRIAKNLKKFIEKEVLNAVFTIEEAKESKSKDDTLPNP